MLMLCFLASAIDVINRIFVGDSIPWSHEVSKYTVVTMGFVFVGHITRAHSHILVDLVIKRVRGMTWRILSAINMIAIFIFCVLATNAGLEYVGKLMARDVNTLVGEWSVVSWPIHLFSTVLGFGIATIYAIITFVDEIKNPQFPVKLEDVIELSAEDLERIETEGKM